MTVEDWIRRRSRNVRPELTDRIVAALGAEREAGETRTAELCLDAATRALDTLVSEGHFGRDSAVDLLTIDALVTFAFQYAAESKAGADDLDALARRAARVLGQLATQRV